MSKLSRILTAVLAAVIMMSCAAGCAKEEPADEGEVIAAAKELLEAAVEVNRIFFWEGLPHVEPDENDSVDIGDAEYLELTEEYAYVSESELMEKAKAVYTEAYSEDIRKIAFEGIAVNDDEALYARYITELGVMKINRKLSEEGLSERLPQIDTVKTVELGHDTAVVSVDFVSEGKTESQNVTLKLEESGWRLDTPTY